MLIYKKLQPFCYMYNLIIHITYANLIYKKITTSSCELWNYRSNVYTLCKNVSTIWIHKTKLEYYPLTPTDQPWFIYNHLKLLNNWMSNITYFWWGFITLPWVLILAFSFLHVFVTCKFTLNWSDHFRTPYTWPWIGRAFRHTRSLIAVRSLIPLFGGVHFVK